MSYQALARQWRPKTFAELVGQAHVVTALQNALTRGRMHHAYLLTGTRGVGKTTLARILAKSLNCEQGVTATPCGQCAACTAIDEGRFVDLLELDAASNTGIDNMREILDNARYAPTAGRYKVYLIDEVHMLSKAAFNSMLKTLEEPPEHVKFILATTDPQKIPVTVLSRCLQFSLKPLPAAEVKARLEHILGAEKIAFDDAGLVLIARAARGSLRDALSLLDQAVAYGGGSVQEMQVRAMLGTVDRDYVYRLVEALVAHDGATLLAEADSLTTRGLDAGAVLDELAALFHRIAVAQVVPTAATNFDDGSRIAPLAAQLAPEDVQLFYQITLQGRGDLALSPDEVTGMGMTLLRLLAFAPGARTVSPASPTGAAAIPSTHQKPTIHAPPARPKLTSPVATAAVEAQENDKAVPAVHDIEPTVAVMMASDVPQYSAAEPPPPPYQASVVERQEADERLMERAPATVAEPPPVMPVAEKVPAQGLPDNAADWSAWVTQLALKGMAAQLAAHTEWRGFDGSTLTLALPEAQRHLTEKSYADKLKKSLEDAVGRKLILTFEMVPAVEGSLAAQQRQAREQAQQETEEAFRGDPFVQALQKEGGQVRWDTVRAAAP